MEISDGERIKVLMAQIEERYNASHKMRDRSMQFGLWILGLGLGMAWVLISSVTLNNPQKIFLLCFLIVVGFLSITFVRAIERGFKNNHDVVIRLETLLKLYEEGFYDPHGSILPKEFAERKFRWSGHFQTLYSIMIAVFLLLIILTCANPPRSPVGSSPETQKTQQIQKKP
jgi:ABC-type branched-subunit amino acid transport system permease subunit